jgi:hypothetical protein
MKEVAWMLGCGPASIMEVLKEKIASNKWMDDLQDKGRRISRGSKSSLKKWSA